MVGSFEEYLSYCLVCMCRATQVCEPMRLILKFLPFLIFRDSLNHIYLFKTSTIFMVVKVWFRILVDLKVVSWSLFNACFKLKKITWSSDEEPKTSFLEKRFSNLGVPRFRTWWNICKQGGKIQVEKMSYP